ncbi:Uncharacterised protein [Mycobacteroides abscessus subsp. abscessus]|nr:hypothetical protein [Mycobacteroides abscessus]SKQ76421.1 Uncharacterised protein [Mycobacteroides abscessus subsp. abscessus]
MLGLRQPQGLVFGTAPANWTTDEATGHGHAVWPQHVDYPLVYGEMNGGLDILLLDAHLTVFGEKPRTGIMNFSGANAVFDAWAALVGSGAPSEATPLLIDSGVVQVPHLEAFAGKSPIAEKRFHIENLYEQEKPEFAAIIDKESRQTWQDESAEVSLYYQLSMDVGGWYSFGIAASPVVSVKLTTPVPLSEFLIQWAWPLRELVAAATGRREDITYLTCSPVIDGDARPHALRQFQVFNASVSQKPYTSENSLRDKNISAIRISEGESLLALLRRWQDLTASENPILNTYDMNAVGPNQHPRARFLLLLQALEGLHGYEYQMEIDERQTKHTVLREPVLSRCKSALAELPGDFKFIKKFLRKQPLETFDAAIRKMLEILPVDLEPELEQSALVQSVRSDNETVSTTLDAIRIARNGLSHGTKAYNRQELAEAANILERAVRGHLFRLLEASPEAIERVLSPDD